MGIFSKKPKPDFIAACVDDPAQGYERIKLSTYRDKYAYDGIRNLGHSQIRSVAFMLGDADGSKLINVYANGKHRIGTIYRNTRPDAYAWISSGKVRSASVEIVDRDEVYLYIK